MSLQPLEITKLIGSLSLLQVSRDKMDGHWGRRCGSAEEKRLCPGTDDLAHTVVIGLCDKDTTRHGLPFNSNYQVPTAWVTAGPLHYLADWLTEKTGTACSCEMKYMLLQVKKRLFQHQDNRFTYLHVMSADWNWDMLLLFVFSLCCEDLIF